MFTSSPTWPLKMHVLCRVGKNIINIINKTLLLMFYRHNKTFWYQFCTFKYFLKSENSEDSLASSCEEFCISFHVTQHETGLLVLELALAPQQVSPGHYYETGPLPLCTFSVMGLSKCSSIFSESSPMRSKSCIINKLSGFPNSVLIVRCSYASSSWCPYRSCILHCFVGKH